MLLLPFFFLQIVTAPFGKILTELSLFLLVLELCLDNFIFHLFELAGGAACLRQERVKLFLVNLRLMHKSVVEIGQTR